MARPNKFNLHYFPMEVDFFDDHKIISIEEEFGIDGSYFALRLMGMAYKDNGYYLDFPENFEFTVSKRLGNGFTSTKVLCILNACFKHKIFNKNLFEKHRIITSKGIQKRWESIQKDLRRKIEVNVSFWLVSSEETPVSATETLFIPEETIENATLSTQKKIKEKEIKENIPFVDFWEVYDKKVGDKQKIEKKWLALSDKEREKAMEHIPKYKISQPDKQYRKDPSTYLNNKSFNDEIISRINQIIQPTNTYQQQLEEARKNYKPIQTAQ